MKRSVYLLLILLFVANCKNKNEDIDKEKPRINISFAEAFPKNCDTLYFGDTSKIIIEFSDNQELGSFNINIHHNFDHHSHTTETSLCNQDLVKLPINPFSYIQDFVIPSGTKIYQTKFSLYIPASNQQGLFDEGDYHFFISVTDRSGWSAVKGLSIKMKRR